MAAGVTFSPIASYTFASAAANYTFTSIPQTYTDLVLVINVIAGANANYLYIQYNGDTNTNYSTTVLTGTGTSAISNRWANRTNFNIDYYATPATTPGQRTIHIMNYANSTTYKTAISRADRASGTSYSGTAGTDAIVGLWRSTSAITSIKITCDNDNFSSGTTMSLYGIASA